MAKNKRRARDGGAGDVRKETDDGGAPARTVSMKRKGEKRVYRRVWWLVAENRKGKRERVWGAERVRGGGGVWRLSAAIAEVRYSAKRCRMEIALFLTWNETRVESFDMVAVVLSY
ncbi:hypothetical protein L1987_06329 [Smallanthus sonchifolius]|uniref:Uncharacterized protein n=1 Tax=Smallanthus sonchifolius TaxID=185202 RepID=A0ACB9JXX1_9ASTR|nr:hypothetical protein L1987_06329 [Smallanthus sonchifolius]